MSYKKLGAKNTLPGSMTAKKIAPPWIGFAKIKKGIKVFEYLNSLKIKKELRYLNTSIR